MGGILGSNFRLALSGSGATWKAPGEDKGTPLYGFGIYLAERVTKADEYSKPLKQDELVSLAGAEVAEKFKDLELYCLLVVRCVGGRIIACTTNEFDKEKLKSSVFD